MLTQNVSEADIAAIDLTGDDDKAENEMIAQKIISFLSITFAA